MTPQEVKLIIQGRPISKDNEKLFGRGHGRPFTSKKYKNYAKDVAIQATNQMNALLCPAFDIPIQVDMRFFFANDSRIDLFNAPKSICDALNKIAWKDDRLIHIGNLSIGYSEEERTEIRISPAYLVRQFMGSGKAFVIHRGMPKGIIKSIKNYCIENPHLTIEII